MKTKHLFRSMLLVILIVLSISCSKDDEQESTESTPNNTTQLLDNAKLSMSFDLTTYTYARAVDPDAQGALTDGERSLSIVNGVGCKGLVEVSEDGEIAAEITMTNPIAIPNYPPRTVGVHSVPEKFMMDKMIFRDGKITTYNTAGEILADQSIAASSLSFYEDLIERITEQAPYAHLGNLTEDHKEHIISGMIEGGFDIRNTILDNIKILKHSYADGSYSEVILDTDLFVVKGQANFDSNGEIQTKSYFSFEGSPSQPVLKEHFFVTYMDAPISGIKMSIVKHSIFENFTFQVY